MDPKNKDDPTHRKFLNSFLFKFYPIFFSNQIKSREIGRDREISCQTQLYLHGDFLSESQRDCTFLRLDIDDDADDNANADADDGVTDEGVADANGNADNSNEGVDANADADDVKFYYHCTILEIS